MVVNTRKNSDPVAKFPSWPQFDEDQILAVRNVLESGQVNYWTGDEGRLFEKEFASFAGCQYAIALANGTVALELALAALGIGDGDEVIVTSYTFIASASAVVMRGAKPIVVDVDSETLNITTDTVRPLINPRTKAIIAVHLVGQPCDIDPLLDLAKEFKLKVIEDCAQAHGAIYKGKPVGSFGDAAAFSFCQDKIMTTGGEGGMLTTNDKTVWQYSSAYKDHGKSYETVSGHEDANGFRWLHDSFGTNWRMTEMQAALGRVQLNKLADWLLKRRSNAKALETGFMTIPGLRVISPIADVEHSYYKYYVFVEPAKLKANWSRDRIMDAISAKGIPCFSGICPEIYRERAFIDAGFTPLARLPVAKICGETSLLFLVHPTLNSRHMHDTIRVLSEVMASAVV